MKAKIVLHVNHSSKLNVVFAGNEERWRNPLPSSLSSFFLSQLMFNFLISFEDFKGLLWFAQELLQSSQVLGISFLFSLSLINFGNGLLRSTSIHISLSWYSQPQICFVMLSSPGIYCPAHLLFSSIFLFFVVYLCQFHVYVYHPPGREFGTCYASSWQIHTFCRVQCARIPFKY